MERPVAASCCARWAPVLLPRARCCWWARCNSFAANVSLARPAVRLGVESAYLAGDWLCADYPATLEGAVRSGVTAARTLMQDWTKKNDANV